MGPGPRVAIGSGGGTPGGGYTPLVPNRSPYTSDPAEAVRIAWRVLVGALALLVVVVVGVPLARNWYVGAAVEPREARTRPIDGVVFLRRQGTDFWVAAGPDEKVTPGDVLRTAQNARAFVTLFDDSTVLLYPSSTVRILRAEQGRFLPDKRSVILELSQGRARLGVAPAPMPSAAFFQLRTPHAEVHLEEGSFSADVSKEETQVSARVGQATAYGAQGTASARAGQRLVVPASGAPGGALPFRRDLVANGYLRDREEGLPARWSSVLFSEQPPEATVSLDTRPGAVTFRRMGSAHARAVLSQPLDFDLWDYEKVVLSAEIRVLGHTLSGGGQLGTEYPILLRVEYTDDQGRRVDWYRGYYLHNREALPTRYGYGFGERLETTDWQRVEVDLLGQVPRPWRLHKVEVEASGWDFESAVREVRVWAE